MVSLVFLTLLALAIWLEGSDQYWRFSRFAVAGAGLSFVALLAVQVQRLHDIGGAGSWVLTLLFPPFWAMLWLVLLVMPGQGRKRIRSSRANPLAVAALLILGVIAVLRVSGQPAMIASDAMTPALLAGDVVVLRFGTGPRYQRGDVVLVRSIAGGHYRPGRVIGIGGDRVQMKEGQVWLNGQPLPQTAAGEFLETMAPQGPARLRPRCLGGAVGDGGTCRKALYGETLPTGKSYQVLNIENGAYSDDTSEFTVPLGSYFLLGDNRDNSIDSRMPVAVGGLGFVPEELVAGRVAGILLSVSGDRMWKFWTWRPGRILETM